MASPPAFQFYASDFLASTRRLSVHAVGAYIRMLCDSWENGPIPNTPAALSKAMGLSPDDPPFDQLWAELGCKWTLTERGWVNSRQEKVRANLQVFIESKRRGGRASGRKRRQLSAEHKSNTSRTHNEHKSQQKTNSPVSNLQSSVSSSELHSPKNVSSAPMNGAQPVAILTFPTIGAGGHSWGLTDAQLAEWGSLYPGLNVLAEAQKALAWVKANQGRRKTVDGMPRFLVNWLNTATNRRGSGSVHQPTGKGHQTVDAVQAALVKRHGGGS